MPRVVKIKRRHRTPSVEAEIKQRAAQIQRDQMSEAMKAAALMVVGRKLDEAITLLRSIGATSSSVDVGTRASSIQRMDVQSASVPVVQRPCGECGRESFYRTKPNYFCRTGKWLCPAHYPLRRQYETGNSGGEAITVAPEVGNAQPQVVVNGGPPLPPDKPDTGGDVGIADAFAAVGIQTNAQ